MAKDKVYSDFIMKQHENMLNIFRIIEKVEHNGTTIGIEFQLVNKKKDSKTIQTIVRALLSQHGIESSFGLTESGQHKNEFNYENFVMYSIMYTNYNDGRKSVIALAHPKLDSIKDLTNLMIGTDI